MHIYLHVFNRKKKLKKTTVSTLPNRVLVRDHCIRLKKLCEIKPLNLKFSNSFKQYF